MKTQSSNIKTKKSHLRLFILCLALFSAGQAAHAAQELDIWGASHHTDRAAGFNEKNYGLGYSYYLIDNENYGATASAGFFRDSMYNVSLYAGSKIYYKINNFVSAGGLVFLMSRPNYKKGRPFLGALPLARLRLADHLILNLTYIPSIKKVGLKEAWGAFLSIYF